MVDVRFDKIKNNKSNGTNGSVQIIVHAISEIVHKVRVIKFHSVLVVVVGGYIRNNK